MLSRYTPAQTPQLAAINWENQHWSTWAVEALEAHQDWWKLWEKHADALTNSYGQKLTADDKFRVLWLSLAINGRHHHAGEMLMLIREFTRICRDLGKAGWELYLPFALKHPGPNCFPRHLS